MAELKKVQQAAATKAGQPVAKAGVETASANKKKSSSWWFLGMSLFFLAEIMGVVGMLIILPQKAEKISSMRTEALSLTMSDQDEQLLTQSLTETVAAREMLTSAFPTENDLLDFIRLIDEIRESEVTVVSFSVDSDVPTKIGVNPSFLPMTLSLNGDEGQVDAALNKIVDSKYFVRPITLIKEFVPDTTTVNLQVQFHLFVNDEFVSSNS